jgi:kinesin family protein 11
MFAFFLLTYVLSRSHCIFTITIYMQEKTSEGLDVFKVGKLNLVDLAGSENSKSAGSVNMRAREAASINRSLLTLGRVINSLVDKTPHIPYRESKLTRLLKDSLGGRTKTCIIATVSPSQQNQEEIRNTLDYASHAKGICNKPQRNHHINHERRVDSLLRTIDQLQEELRVNYEKHGVYQTKRQYDAKEQELQQLKDNNSNLQTTNSHLLQAQQENKERADRKISAVMSRIRETEDALNLEKKEKDKLIVEHDISVSKMKKQYITEIEKLKREFAAREKKMAEETKLKELELKEEFKQKELDMKEKDRANQQKHRESIESIKQFLSGSFTDIDAKLSSFISDMNDGKYLATLSFGYLN